MKILLLAGALAALDASATTDAEFEARRRAHWSFFSRECARIGRQPSQDMPVVCTSFEVLHVVPLSRPCPG